MDPGPGLLHQRDRRAAAEPRAEEIELDAAPELLQRRFGKRTIGSARSAGIVVENVEPSEHALYLRERSRHAVFFRDVRWRETGPAAGRLNGTDDRATLGSASPCHKNICALAGKEPRGFRTDAARRAGDEGNLSCQAHDKLQ